MSSFDKGAFVASPIIIEPCMNGGYLVRRAYDLERPSLLKADIMAFSNWIDLLSFLSEEYKIANAPPARPSDNSIKSDRSEP